VKICGIITKADARLALDCGADWIGVNLVGGPRQIGLEAALTIAEAVDHPRRVVALLHDESTKRWRDSLHALAAAGIGGVQCYGECADEISQEARRAGLLGILVGHVLEPDGGRVWSELADRCRAAKADYALLDAADASRLGGTGRRLDWSGMSDKLRTWRSSLPPVILAGGLTPDNVSDATARCTPDGVDVSSGVEQAPGRKDPTLVRAFVSAARGE